MRLALPKTVQLTLDAWSHRLPRSLAIALDLISADPEDAGLIRGAQINAIVRLTPLTMVASCLNAVVVLATFATMGALRPELCIWALLLFAMAINFWRAWWPRRHEARRSASRRAIRRVIRNGCAYGVLWGVVPAVTFPGAPLEIQLFVACLTAGMMSACGFALATVPLAGMACVALVAVGTLAALLQETGPVYLGIILLLASYATVLIVNVNWSASLFVNSLLAEAQVRKEVAARELAQAQSAHADRMTALGELAGGIAHDFNNILQVVSGGAAHIGRHPENRDDVVRQARRIQDAVERGSAITRRLLAFARRDALSAEPIDAAGLLTDLGEMLGHAIGPSINVHVDVTTTPGCFLADRGQLDTVLLNLATNARDAMPNGGDLTISAVSIVLDHDSDVPRLNAGRYLCTTVRDTGVGIDAATLPRVAEPFFTTKPRGKGTGLGVSMAKGFAEQSGGAFAIASEPGRGTTVTLWLPQADGGVATQTKDPAYGAAVGAGRRVLVVEDDELVREVLMTSLEDVGFVTLGAENAASAIARLDQGGGVDALITDFSMPGMNGLDLIHEVHARKPGLPAILLTGHVSDVAVHKLQTEHFTLLLKPMQPAHVAERLAALMATAA